MRTNRIRPIITENKSMVYREKEGRWMGKRGKEEWGNTGLRFWNEYSQRYCNSVV